MEQPSWGKWGSWEETEAFLNQEIGRTLGADPVEKGSIRRWLESKEFGCPLHYSDEAAQEAGYEGLVAPATMAVTYGIGPYWKPGDKHEQLGDEPTQISIPVIFDVPAPCTLSFATNIDIEFFEPMCLGDEITCTSKLVNIEHKTLRVGKGAFLRQEDTYTNQKDEVVAVATLDIFRFVPPQKEQDNG